MDINMFDFDLPEELIAQTPLKDRTASRLMVLDPATGKVEHNTFKNIIDYLNPGDCLVLNDTRVLPARLLGEKEDTKAKIEILLLKETGDDTWETLVKPAKRVKPGTTVVFGNGLLKAVCTGETDQGGRTFKFEYEGIFTKFLMRWVKCLFHLTLKNSWKSETVIRPFMPSTRALLPLRPRDYILRNLFLKILRKRCSCHFYYTPCGTWDIPAGIGRKY